MQQEPFSTTSTHNQKESEEREHPLSARPLPPQVQALLHGWLSEVLPGLSCLVVPLLAITDRNR